MSKIMVTGAAGFLGSFLIERLINDDYYVVGIDNLFRGRKDNIKHIMNKRRFEFHLHDIKKPLPRNWFLDTEAVFHYAAINGTLHFYERPLEVLETNVEGTINVLKASANYGVKKFIYASSSEVYGEPKEFPIKEEDPIILPSLDNPRYSYAASKVMGEFYVKWLSRKTGMSYIILRIFNTYGPRMDSSSYGQVIPEFIRKALLEQKFTIIGPGNQTRSFCYVDDHVEVILRLYKRANDEVVNVGNDEEIKIVDLARIIHEIIGRRFTYKLLPPREGDPTRRIPSIKKAISLTDYRPKISLRDGLKRTIEWYKKH